MEYTLILPNRYLPDSVFARLGISPTLASYFHNLISFYDLISISSSILHIKKKQITKDKINIEIMLVFHKQWSQNLDGALCWRDWLALYL